jgi:hypothetical protein
MVGIEPRALHTLSTRSTLSYTPNPYKEFWANHFHHSFCSKKVMTLLLGVIHEPALNSRVRIIKNLQLIPFCSLLARTLPVPSRHSTNDCGRGSMSEWMTVPCCIQLRDVAHARILHTLCSYVRVLVIGEKARAYKGMSLTPAGGHWEWNGSPLGLPSPVLPLPGPVWPPSFCFQLTDSSPKGRTQGEIRTVIKEVIASVPSTGSHFW